MPFTYWRARIACLRTPSERGRGVWRSGLGRMGRPADGPRAPGPGRRAKAFTPGTERAARRALLAPRSDQTHAAMADSTSRNLVEDSKWLCEKKLS